MRKFDVWAMISFSLCGLFALYAIFTAFPSLSKWLPGDSAALASWVQGVGTIAAIIYGGRYVRSQIAAGQDLEQAAYQRRLSSIQEVFEQAYDAATTALNHTSSLGNAQWYLEFHHTEYLFKDLQNALAKIGIEQMESREGIRALLNMRRAIEQAEHMVLTIGAYDDFEWGSVDQSDLEELRGKVQGALLQSIYAVRKITENKDK